MRRSTIAIAYSLAATRIVAPAHAESINVPGARSTIQEAVGTDGVTGCESHLRPSDGAADDRFGSSVSISGDMFLVGSPGHDALGATYVYRWSEPEAQWVEGHELVPSDGAADDRFGCSVSMDGDVAIVGARWDDDLGYNAGAAYVYRWTGWSWIEEQKLTAAAGAAGDDFGFSVSVDGDLAIVGAYGDAQNRGSACVYHWDGSSWVEEQKLMASDGAQGDRFGHSVSVSGNVVAVGAYRADSVYVYRRSGVPSSWTEEAKLTRSRYHGVSVCVHGDRLIAGAYGDAGFGYHAGAAFVYRWTGSSWVTEHMLTASDAGAEQWFGWSVFLRDDLAMVGTQPEWMSPWYGAAYVYRRHGVQQWVEEHKLTASDGTQVDGFAYAGAFTGNTVLVAAPFDDAPSTMGSVYLYELSCLSSCPDLDGDGLVSISDLLTILAGWGTSAGDVTGDGTTDVADLLAVLGAWGPCE